LAKNFGQVRVAESAPDKLIQAVGPDLKLSSELLLVSADAGVARHGTSGKPANDGGMIHDHHDDRASIKHAGILGRLKLGDRHG
jgi:hypothetical protein